MSTIAILRIRQVIARTGISRAGIYSGAKSGAFPRPVKLTGARSSGWPEHEVAAVLEARIAGQSEDQVRALVRKLEAARGAAARGR